MANTIATSDFGAIWTLGKFVIASYAALIVMYIIHLLIVTGMGLNPVTFVKKTSEVLLFAFTSRSSAGALPLNVQTQKSFRCARWYCKLLSFIWSFYWSKRLCRHLSSNVSNHGSAAAGVEVNLQFILSVIGIVVISSFGVAGVGGGATFASIIVLSTLNLPVALAGVLISVEPLIDMGRTALNVNDSMLAGTGTAKLTNNLDTDTYHSKEYGKSQVHNKRHHTL